MPKQAKKRARSSKSPPRSYRISARSDFSDMHARAAKVAAAVVSGNTDQLYGAGTHTQPPTPVIQPIRLMGTNSATRKRYPVTTGLLDYFPDACQACAEISYVGNMRHNPGEPMHHARGKSNDHADCIGRHLLERGGFDIVMIDGIEYHMRHSAALMWRAAALLQEELEAEGLVSLPRAAKI